MTLNFFCRTVKDVRLNSNTSLPPRRSYIKYKLNKLSTSAAVKASGGSPSVVFLQQLKRSTQRNVNVLTKKIINFFIKPCLYSGVPAAFSLTDIFKNFESVPTIIIDRHQDLFFLLFEVGFLILLTALNILGFYLHPELKLLPKIFGSTLLVIRQGWVDFYRAAPTLIILVLSPFTLVYSLDEITTFSITLRVGSCGWKYYYNYVLSNASSDNFKSLIWIPKSYKTVFFTRYSKEMGRVAEESLKFNSAKQSSEIANRLLFIPRTVPLSVTGIHNDVFYEFKFSALDAKLLRCPGRLDSYGFLQRFGINYGRTKELHVLELQHVFLKSGNIDLDNSYTRRRELLSKLLVKNNPQNINSVFTTHPKFTGLNPLHPEPITREILDCKLRAENLPPGGGGRYRNWFAMWEAAPEYKPKVVPWKRRRIEVPFFLRKRT